MLRRLIERFVGTGLIFVGILILVGTVGFFVYAQYEQAALASQAEAMSQPVAAISPPPTPTPDPNTTSSAQRTTVVPTPPAAPTGTSTAMPTATQSVRSETHSTIVRVSAASIGLDAKVAESPVVNGQWVIPKFEAGHLQGTGQPGSGGNVVLAGHVQSITSGDVFANIDQLKPGDKIEIYTRNAAVTYVVHKVTQVGNDDISVLKPGPHETLTLITCSGNWLPLQHDYSQRTVVVADRA